MGHGSYDPGEYTRRTSAKVAAGVPIFTHSATSHATGVFEVHETLDPRLKAGPGSPHEGKVMRESRDSDEHPETIPIAVLFDVTGSMGGIPPILQSKMKTLHALLMAKGYVEHPQILFGSIGDANSDRVPLQIGQFESSNVMDENLENILLEGGGGGGNHESYELGAYFLARHTSTDAWEKRGKRGYAFFIGDERAYETINRRQVEDLIGDTLQEDLTTAEVFAELKELYDVYFLFAAEGNYQLSDAMDTKPTHHGASLGWRDYLGQQALVMDSAEAVCETIAIQIGLAEGVIDVAAGLADLAAVGTDATTIARVQKTLVGAGVGGGDGGVPAVTTGSAILDDLGDADAGVDRL